MTPVVPTYTVGGTIAGLTGSAVLENNAGNDLSTSTNGAFTFSTPLAQGSAYNVTVKTNPSGQVCTVTNPSGTIAAANVTNVSISCVTQTGSGLSVQYQSTDANNIEYFSYTSPNDGYGTQTLRVLVPTHPAAGVAHNFLYVLPVEPGVGSTFGDGMQTMAALDAQDQYDLTIIEPSFSFDPWYADNPNDANLHYETFMTIGARALGQGESLDDGHRAELADRVLEVRHRRTGPHLEAPGSLPAGCVLGLPRRHVGVRRIRVKLCEQLWDRCELPGQLPAHTQRSSMPTSRPS